MKNYSLSVIVALFACSSILAVLFSTSCNIGNNIDDVPRIDTLHWILPIWDTVYFDAEYIDVSAYPEGGTDTHFDSTIIHDGTYGVLLQMYGFPILFSSEGIDTEFRLMGGSLEGDREDPIYLRPVFSWDGYEGEGHEVHWDTIYEHMNYYPDYVITQLESEGVFTTDTFILDYDENLFKLHDSWENTRQWYWNYEQVIMNFPHGPSFDKFLFSNWDYEVYFTDIMYYDSRNLEATDYSLLVIPRRIDGIR